MGAIGQGAAIGLVMMVLAMAMPLEAGAKPAVSKPASDQVDASLTIEGVETLTMRSSVGREFAIYIYRPIQPPPPGGYPVAYFLDAEDSLGMMVESAKLLSDAGRSGPVAMVGIGVPRGDDLNIWYDRVSRDRSYDYTPPVAADHIAKMNTETYPGGGAPDLLNFIIDDLMPVVETRLPVDKKQQLLTGHSYGGLFTLFSLLERPDVFSFYLISSPSIWYGDGAVLARRKGFEERMRKLSVKPRVMIAVGENEEPNADNIAMLDRNPEYAAVLRQRKMVTRVREMGDWLVHQGLSVNVRIADHADHGTAKSINFIHGLALAMENQKP